MGTLNRLLSFVRQSLFTKVSPSEKREFLTHLKSDTRLGIQIGAWLVIGLFSTFMIIDLYILPPEWVGIFRITRIAICLIDAIIIYALRKGRFQRGLEYVGLYICLSVGLAIVAMVQVSGGASSPYYAGVSLTIVGFGVAIPWPLRYSLVSCGVLYFSYVASSLIFSQIEDWSLFINNNGFLLTNVVMSLTMTQLQCKFRLNKFLSDKKILRANEDLKRLDQAKSEFFSNISHELKTPATLVVTTLENQLRNVPKNDYDVAVPRKVINTVRQNALRLSRLISDLLDLTKSEIGKARIRPVEIHDPQEFFKNIFDSIVPLIESKGLLHEFGAEGALKSHYFDREKMDKVAINLLSNAIKFTPKGGKVAMKVWDDEGVLKISVSDTGIGIPPDQMDKVFERFMQVDASSTRAYSGMGIGLSLVKDFVEFHGGMVGVESEPGKGTTFTISLPRGREHFKATVVDKGEEGQGIEIPAISLVETMKEEPEEKEEEATDWKKETILVVDDNAEIRWLLRDILGKKHRVLQAKDGEEGVQKAREKRPSLVICDIMMPRKDGYGVLQDLKKDPSTKEIPIILLTAKEGEESLKLGFEFDADDYIRKPPLVGELLARVKNLLELREAKARLAQVFTQDALLTMAAGWTHNLGQVIGSMGAALTVVRDFLTEHNCNLEEKREELKESISVAFQALDSMKGAVGNFMTYSQINRTKFSDSNIHEGLETAIHLLSLDSQSKIIRNYEATDPVIYCNLQELHLAFLNVLNNALEAIATKEEGRVWVRTRNENGNLVISFEDNGGGMTEEVKKRVFEPFFTTKDVGSPFSGIGMWTVYETVRAHQGEITPESYPGKGSTFTIRLPTLKSEQLERKGAINYDYHQRFGADRG